MNFNENNFKQLTLKDLLSLEETDHLLYLLNERNAIANQNSQLWKLIEFQKSTISQLQKDVQKLLKRRHLDSVRPLDSRRPSFLSIDSNSFDNELAYNNNLTDNESVESFQPQLQPTPAQISPPEIIAPKPIHLNKPTLKSQSPPATSVNNNNNNNNNISGNRFYNQSNHSFDDALTKYPIKPAMLTAIEKAQSTQTSQRSPYMQQFNHSFTSLPTTKSQFPSSPQSLTLQPPVNQQQPQQSQQSQQSQHSPKPSVFKLTPTIVPQLKLTVTTSSIKPNKENKDQYSFTINVKHEQSNAEWKVEKSYETLASLDIKLREIIKKPYFKHTRGRLLNLPDKNAFKDRSPNKIIHQRILIENYINSVLSIPHTYSIIPKNSATPHMEIAAFLSSDFARTPVSQTNGFKEGYLTKKGKNFGGWKARYFVIGKEGILDYFESRAGSHIGSIRIHEASIGRQHPQRSQNDSSNFDTESNTFRHAFLIIERLEGSQKEKDRHILCAENDHERDSWINTLLWHQRAHSNASASSPLFPHEMQSKSVSPPTAADETPLLQSTGVLKRRATNSKPKSRDGEKPRSRDGIDVQVNSSPLPINSLPPEVASKFQIPQALQDARNSSSQDAGSMNNDSSTSLPLREDSRHSYEKNPLSNNNSNTQKEKSKGVQISGPMNGVPLPEGVKFGENLEQETQNDEKSEKSEKQQERERKAKSRGFWGAFSGSKDKSHQQKPVFGTSLNDSLQTSSIAGLPSVVFRCIQYLQHVHADEEEGIYRLSGSSTQVRSLKERFNHEGDINLVESGEYYDPHAITGILKLYFRELPTSVLTRELHYNFLQVTDQPDPKKRIKELGRLVCALPISNYALLRALISHLTDIVANEDLNRMSLRNVGIVFSPTLGIPAPLFGLFLTEFKYVFNVSSEGKPEPLQESSESEVESTQEEIEEEEMVDVLKPGKSSLVTQTDENSSKQSPAPLSLATDNLNVIQNTSQINEPLSPSLPIPPRPSRQRRDNRNSALYEDVDVDNMLGLKPKNITASKDSEILLMDATNDTFDDSDVDPDMIKP